MAVMAREAWTDERLDDLNERVGRLEMRMDAGFEEMRREFVAVRREMTAQFAAQHRMMVQLLGGMFATMVIGFLGVVATIITQT
ncbi:MAG TPA: hypothetical protein VFL77_07230 [Solirubrobacterales bacterium]|nr:hypothetical protein [Solirubrobacterales bacterium]